jgi:tRNA pseudouridine55 synthase
LFGFENSGMNGIVLVDKPAGWTSHDVVNRWRRLAKTKRAGHLGTLDPMATGLLALVTGQATRLAQYFGQEEKTYRAEITLGLVSDTYDAEGEVRATEAAVPEEPVLRTALEKFKGRLWQTPPAVSAKKINGVAAYKLARKNIAVELKPVEIEIRRLEVEEVDGAHLRVLITSSPGTYIRSIAHDLGEALGCGAILSALRRLEIGRFGIDEAKTLKELETLAAADRLREALIAGEQLLPQFPAERFNEQVEAQIRQGRDFRTSPFVVPPGSPFVRALSNAGELIAIGELRIPNVYHPSTVL